MNTKQAVPEGRVEIEGEVISTRVETGAYGTKVKMLVEDDRGFRVWGNAPHDLECFQVPRKELVGASEVRCMNRVKIRGKEEFTVSRISPDERGFWLHAADGSTTFVNESSKIEAIWWEQRGLEKGDRVKFRATVKPSGDDPKFGFFKRPAGAQIVGGHYAGRI